MARFQAGDTKRGELYVKNTARLLAELRRSGEFESIGTSQFKIRFSDAEQRRLQRDRIREVPGTGPGERHVDKHRHQSVRRGRCRGGRKRSRGPDLLDQRSGFPQEVSIGRQVLTLT